MDDVTRECRVEVTVGKAVMTLSFVVIFGLSLFGNTAVVLTILLRRKRSSSITNLYLLNLAIADLLRSVICMPSTLVSELFQCWMFGPIFCKLAAYLQPVAVTASGYTLAIIAVERFYAICKPLRSRIWHTKKHAMLMIAVVWLISFTANLGTAIMYEALPYKDHWNCQTTNGAVADFFYQLYITLILLFIPLTIMVAMYGNVIFTLKTGIRFDAQLLTVGSLSSIDYGCSLERKPSFSGWLLDAVQFSRKERLKTENKESSSCLTLEVPRSLAPSRQSSLCNMSSRRITSASITGMVSGRNGSCYDLDNSFLLRSTHYEKQLVAKKRVTRMLIIIVIIFTLCWTPSYVWWLMIRTHDMFGTQSVWNHSINTFLTILTYLSTCTNPITYCFMNENFRKMLFSSHFCCKYMMPQKPFAASRANSSNAAVSPSPAARKTTSTRQPEQEPTANNNNNNVEFTLANIPAITIQTCGSNHVSEAHSEQPSPTNANSLL